MKEGKKLDAEGLQGKRKGGEKRGSIGKKEQEREVRRVGTGEKYRGEWEEERRREDKHQTERQKDEKQRLRKRETGLGRGRARSRIGN